jgi:hypothetical protein
MAHSPLPWKHNGNFNGTPQSVAFAIHDRETRIVCQLPEDDCIVLRPDFVTQHRNMEMIVTAVNHHAKLVKLLQDVIDAADEETIESGDGTVYFPYADVREILSAIRDERDGTPTEATEDEKTKLLAWCIRQFEGESGAGYNHWMQHPEFLRAKELIGDEIPVDDD